MDDNFNKELVDAYINKSIQKVVREDLLTECDKHYKLGHEHGYKMGRLKNSVKGFAVGVFIILLLDAILFYF